MCLSSRCLTPNPLDHETAQHAMSPASLWALTQSPPGATCPDVTSGPEGSQADGCDKSPAHLLQLQLWSGAFSQKLVISPTEEEPTRSLCTRASPGTVAAADPTLTWLSRCFAAGLCHQLGFPDSELGLADVTQSFVSYDMNLSQHMLQGWDHAHTLTGPCDL